VTRFTQRLVIPGDHRGCTVHKEQAMKIASLAFALLMGAVIMSALFPLWLAGG
jgi:hypothetical protein